MLLPGERRLLVIGGSDGSNSLATTEILDIDTMAFSPGPAMFVGRWGCAVISLPGSILVVGGCAYSAQARTTEALSLQTMTFAAGPAMLTRRTECAAFVLPQYHSPRRVLVVGGCDGIFFQSTTEVLTTTG